MRKYILWALIGIVSIWFTNADYLNWQPWLYEFNVWQAQQIWNYTYLFDSNANVETDEFKAVYLPYWSPTTQVVFWWINWKMYYYSYKSSQYWTTIRQWFLKNWCVSSNLNTCWWITDNSNYNVTADELNIWTIQNVILWHFNSLSWWNGDPSRNTTLCFYDWNNYYCIACNNIDSWDRSCSSQIDWSLNLDLSTYQKVSEYTWWNSPFTQTTPTQTPITQYSCPTIQQLINAYPEQYNTWLCYSSTTIFSWWQYVQTTPKTIFELYEWQQYIDLRNDINTYTNYCKPPATMQACQNAFTGREENYTFVSKLPSNIEPIKLRSYCNLNLNMSPNATTCVYSTGMITTGISLDDIAREIGDSERTVITPWKASQWTGNESGSVYDKYLGDQEDDDNMFELVRKAKDVIKNMKSIYVKITWIFRWRTGTNGVIPEYITWLICLIVLYKLFKK